MTNYEALRLVVYAIGLPIIFYLCVTAGRKMRAIRDLDARLKEEAEQNAQNPYAQMAQLLEAQELINRSGLKGAAGQTPPTSPEGKSREKKRQAMR